MGNSLLTDTSRPFQVNAFYSDELLSGGRINVCVVRADASDELGVVFTHNRNSDPRYTIALANGNAYNSLSNAAAAIQNLPGRSVIMISSRLVIDNQTINFPPDTILAGYYDYFGNPQIGTITGDRTNLRFRSGAMVNMRILGNVSFINIVVNEPFPNNNFSIANCRFNVTTPLLPSLASRTSLYFLSTNVSGPNPLFSVTKEGTNNSNIYFADCQLSPVNGTRDALMKGSFVRGGAARIIVEFIRSRYFGNRVAVDFFIDITNRTAGSELDVNSPEGDGQDRGLDVYWYNNVIDSEDDYLAKPAETDEYANNYLINAEVLNNIHIHKDKFVKYRYTKSCGEVVTNSGCGKVIKSDK